jgi:hypothetical protein
MYFSFHTRSMSQLLCITLVVTLVSLGVYEALPLQSVLACPGPTGVTYPGTEAFASTITLQMPFIAGETWTVGGAGSFYGNGRHCNS